MENLIQKKKCKICGENKEVTNFYVNKKIKDGYDCRCKICLKTYKQIWYKENLSTIKITQKNWRLDEKNKDKKRSHRRKYQAKRKKHDSMFKFKSSVRSLICTVIKNKNFTKKSKTFVILGCSFDEFKNYMESKFESWMNWENHGKYNGELNYGWDIDHIIPLSSVKTEEDILKLNHYTNLQPLCSYVNRYIKKNKR